MSSFPTIRPATPADVPTVFDLIQGLADYEKLSHEVVGSEAALDEHLFGDRPYMEALLVEQDTTPAGFALFFQTYSSTIGTPGYYLEDLFVFPEFRGRGFGKALLSALARRALDQNFQHLQWSVLDWNAPAIAFYQKIGATVHDHHRIARMTGNALTVLAQSPAIAHHADGERFKTSLVNTRTLRPPVQEHPSSQSEAGFEARVQSVFHALSVHSPPVEALGIWLDDALVGLATITHSYSTFLTQPGLLVESLAIAPDQSPDLAHDIETRLLHALATLAVERHCGRLEWIINHDDERAIAQCQRLGGTVLPDWRICRMGEEAIATLAATR